MKVKERGGWVSLNEGKGGKRPTYDAFNKSFKGKERNPSAQEYASMGMEEYHHYSERAEAKETVDNSKPNKKEQQSSKKNIVKNVVGKVAMVAAGSVVVVSTYTTMTVVDSKNWLWSSDMNTASVELIRSDGVLLREVPAVVTVVQQDPTCTQTGLRTYTATAEDEDEKLYTDVKEETLSPLGHDIHFVETRDENGKVVWVYECSRCHEEYTFDNELTEND